MLLADGPDKAGKKRGLLQQQSALRVCAVLWQVPRRAQGSRAWGPVCIVAYVSPLKERLA